MANRRREEKAPADDFKIVWSGAFLTDDGQTKGELLPRYDRKELALNTVPRVFPRKYKSAD
jgi:hypothetical protein